MRRALVLATRAAARAVVARINTALGLPRCVCDRHGGTGGGGDRCTCPDPTAPPSAMCPCVVRRWSRVRQHPTRALFAVAVRPEIDHLLDAAERAAVVTLGAEWAAGADGD